MNSKVLAPRPGLSGRAYHDSNVPSKYTGGPPLFAIVSPSITLMSPPIASGAFP